MILVAAIAADILLAKRKVAVAVTNLEKQAAENI
jgi:hypothetical protein